MKANNTTCYPAEGSDSHSVSAQKPEGRKNHSRPATHKKDRIAAAKALFGILPPEADMAAARKDLLQ